MPIALPIMAQKEKHELTATTDLAELGPEFSNGIYAPHDAPEVHTDSRGNTYRLEVRTFLSSTNFKTGRIRNS